LAELVASPNRRRALGQAGEDAAAAELERLGYRILARNHACRRGEVDIIATEGDCLCFVEVRTRGRAGIRPAETVDRAKQRRIVTAARDYLYRHPAQGPMRFDVAAVTRAASGLLEVELLRNAFDAGE
jgi:putative endonuclease